MKWILFLCCLGSLAGAAPPSSTPVSASATEPERYLFLAETSEGMRKLDQASRQTLFDLVYWGADGHMEGGDTYGLWTFNEDVQSGIFPMQVYDPDLQLPLATRASLFLKEQPYEKKTQTSRLVLKLLSVIITVKDVNVFIITDGEQPIVGLRFDNEIKAACEARRKEARRTKKSFVVTLAARGGDITFWAVTLPGEQIQLPARRPALPKPAPKPAVASLTTNTAARTSVPSITMVAPRPLPPSSVERKQTVRAAVAPGATGENRQEVGEAGTNQLAAVPEATATNAPVSAPSDPTLMAQRAAAAAAEAEIIQRVSQQSSPKKGVETLTNSSLAAVKPPVNAVPKEPTVVAREPGLVPGVVVPGKSGGLEPLLSATELIIAGVILLLIAAALIFILLRRSNPARHGSYITRSMDR